jgi:carbon-monoxide dehydrogenase small subunit
VTNDRVTVAFTLNGAARRVTVPPMKRLLDVLREDCALTGTKEGCGEGECGACTVLLDGLAVNSCLVPAIHAEGAKVTTVEGLATKGRLSALQQAFVEGGAAQCGMCTPGMLVTSAALLAGTRGRVPSETEVREALAGTLCRCTGYQKIVDAVRAAAKPAATRKPSTKQRVAKRRRAKKQPARPARRSAARRSAKKAGRR